MSITQNLRQARNDTMRYMAVIYDRMGNPLFIGGKDYLDLAIMATDSEMSKNPHADHAVIYWHDWQWMGRAGLAHTYNPSLKRTATSSEWVRA